MTDRGRAGARTANDRNFTIATLTGVRGPGMLLPAMTGTTFLTTLAHRLPLDDRRGRRWLGGYPVARRQARSLLCGSNWNSHD